MKDHDVWLSAQPILNDEDGLTFETPCSTAKFIGTTYGTDRNYRLAKEVGVKIAFGTDCLFDPSAAALPGKLLANLKRWFTPFRQAPPEVPRVGNTVLRRSPVAVT